MNIVPTTYYDGEMPVVTTTNLDKMNKMRRTAREMTEAQRDSNSAQPRTSLRSRSAVLG